MLMKNAIQVILLFGIQLLSLAQCAPSSVYLPGVEETYLLAGRDTSTTISCVIFAGVSASTIQWQHNGENIAVDGEKYKLLFNTRLQIDDITGNDEGLYSCSYISAGVRVTQNIVCVFVLGAAEFASSETSTMDLFRGEDALLDTRIVYTGAGPSKANQTVTLLQLFKKQEDGYPGELIYFCSDEGSRQGTPCPSNDEVAATKDSHKFDLKLTLKNLTAEDEGTYLARVEVMRPGVSSRSYISKNFVIRVHEPVDVKVEQRENSISCEVGVSDSDSVTLEWRNSKGEALSDSGNIQLIASTGENLVTLSAEFKDPKSLEGQFSCVASLALAGTAGPNKTVTAVLDLDTKDNATVPTDPTGGSDGDAFQVLIGPVSSVECSVWFDVERSTKMEALIRQGVAAAVYERCNCDVSPADFTTGQLSCEGDWLRFASSVKDAQRSVQLLTAVDEWSTSSKPTITVGLFSLNVNTQNFQLSDRQ